jgi:hypothetical protein
VHGLIHFWETLPLAIAIGKFRRRRSILACELRDGLRVHITIKSDGALRVPAMNK